MIYRNSEPKEFITGEETDYVSANKIIAKKFRSRNGEDIYAAFLSPGTITVPANLENARRKFAESCQDLEDYNRMLGKVSYGIPKDSSKPGKISAKPRFVFRSKRYGFPKGSFETTDVSVDAGALREVGEETGIALDPARLVDADTVIHMGGDSNYSVFTYELTEDEYNAYKAALVIKNASRENELHDIQFRIIPTTLGDFFTNAGSRKAYEALFPRKGGARRTRRLRRRSRKQRK
jgi:8-oxo-dGTP pyrophosphatase MutT (NUDIX family)